MATVERIGFIGLGIMGKPMAKNLLNAGYPLTVWNRTRSKMDELVEAGAQPAECPRDVAQRSDVVITMVADSPDVQQVILGENGVIEGVCEGMVVVDMSTISPKVAREIAEALLRKGVAFLDAPVSGGQRGAIEGTLSIMVGGDERAFQRCLPIFQVLGKTVVHMGESGMGQTTKLANQIICVLNILAICEGLVFAAKMGLDVRKMWEVVSQGAASSWMLSNLAPRILQRDFEPGFLVRLQQKDLRLVLEAALDEQIPLPGTALVNQLFRAVEALGMAEKGTQALVVALEQLANIEVRG